MTARLPNDMAPLAFAQPIGGWRNEPCRHADEAADAKRPIAQAGEVVQIAAERVLAPEYELGILREIAGVPVVREMKPRLPPRRVKLRQAGKAPYRIIKPA